MTLIREPIIFIIGFSCFYKNIYYIKFMKEIVLQEETNILIPIVDNFKYYTLDNIYYIQKEFSIIVKRKVMGNNNKPYYRLEKEISLKLSNGEIITIPEGFIWDLSSVPRILWWLLPPDGDFELATLIHDYLYTHKNSLDYTRKFADNEMLIWSKVVSGTKNTFSIRNLDNQVRYIAVRLFGWIVWNRLI